MKQKDNAFYSLKKLALMGTSRSIAAEFNCGCVCYGDTSHPEDDTYNGGTSFDGW